MESFESNKGDVQIFCNYKGMKLITHTMKIWEREVEVKLREEVMIFEQHYGFRPRRITIAAMCALRRLMEKYTEDQTELHCVFVDLKKSYDRGLREESWSCIREYGVQRSMLSWHRICMRAI